MLLSPSKVEKAVLMFNCFLMQIVIVLSQAMIFCLVEIPVPFSSQGLFWVVVVWVVLVSWVEDINGGVLDNVFDFRRFSTPVSSTLVESYLQHGSNLAQWTPWYASQYHVIIEVLVKAIEWLHLKGAWVNLIHFCLGAEMNLMTHCISDPEISKTFCLLEFKSYSWHGESSLIIELGLSHKVAWSS